MRYQPQFSLPTEFILAAACCRWSFSGDSPTEIAKLAPHVDWPLFLETCRRHRVQALTWHALNKLEVTIPLAVRTALCDDAHGIVNHNLRSAAESQRIANAFAAAGIPMFFLKGLTLGRLAYGDPFLKMGWDVDILVVPADISKAGGALAGLKYDLELPNDCGMLERWHRSRKESVWVKGDGLVVELHSRVADQPQLLAEVTAACRRQIVEVVPGIDLPTLIDDELFAYLCVHGASSAWFRLKWAADLAGFLHGRSQQAIERLYDHACAMGAGRAASQALLLVNWLFDSVVPSSLDRRIATAANHWLAHVALREMLRDEPTSRPFGTRMIHLTQFMLMPGWSYKLAELGRQARVATGSF